MVGAIADWFAVTALFKHPLGLPIPHTALIPRRKDELGRSLEEFVGENFLQETIIRERIDAARLSAAGRRLADRRGERAPGGRRGRRGAAHRRCRGSATRTWSRWWRRRCCRGSSPSRSARSPAACSRRSSRDGAHHGLVDLALDEAHRWLTQNEETFVEIVGERAPWWSPAAAQRPGHPPAPPRGGRLGRGHPATTPTTTPAAPWTARSTQLAHDLLHDPETQERMERLKGRVLCHPQLLVTATSLWNAFRRALMDSLDDPEGPLRRRALDELRASASRLARGRGAARQGWTATPPTSRCSRSTRYGDELTAVITHTVEPLGRQGGRPPDRAARRPRPAVHPDQRHHRRRPGRRADPRGDGAAVGRCQIPWVPWETGTPPPLQRQGCASFGGGVRRRAPSRR